MVKNGFYMVEGKGLKEINKNTLDVNRHGKSFECTYTYNVYTQTRNVH